MGTNYYAVHDTCGHCGRFERTHICKSHIIFRAHFTWDSDGDPEPWLTSWADWRHFLCGPKVDHIVDEYGDRHDIAAFIDRVEATDLAARRRQYDWCANDPQPYRKLDVVEPDADWLDPDGFSFHGGGFS
jgi:hypothetical protein